MMRRRRRWLVLGGAVLVACTFAGAVVGSRLGDPPPDLAALTAATRDAPMISVDTLPAGNGKAARGAYAQISSTGEFCLWDAPSATSSRKQGGCNPADDPLGGHPLSASLAYDGGPRAARVTDARLIGLVSRDVAAVEVVMTDGSRRSLALRNVPASVGEFRAFAHRFGRGEIRSGGPVAVVALDANGVEIDRQATGF
jgi:hypothetical protein